MAEFLFQDLKGGIPPCLMNALLSPGMKDTNKNVMKYLKSRHSLAVEAPAQAADLSA